MVEQALALPDIDAARLPHVYLHAREALSSCSRIDECQDWADKAEALASYAKQSHDDTLHKLADRIQARAIRRAGELLKQIAAAFGANQNIRDGADPNVPTRKSAAKDAGLSERQRKTALRVAEVPADEFEAAVESDHPPTVTQLAKRGMQSKPPPEPWMVEMAHDQRRPPVCGGAMRGSFGAAGYSVRRFLSPRGPVSNAPQNARRWL